VFHQCFSLCILQCPHNKPQKNKNNKKNCGLCSSSFKTFTSNLSSSQTTQIPLSLSQTHSNTVPNSSSYFNHGGRTLRRHNLQAPPPQPPPPLSQNNPSHTPFLSLENFPPHNLPKDPKVVTFHCLCPHPGPQTKHPHGN